MTVTLSIRDAHATSAVAVVPGSFSRKRVFYSRALHAQVHPTVAHFLGMKAREIAVRYCRLNPGVSLRALVSALATRPRFFTWGGAGLIPVVAADGQRRLVLLETTSCPSGCKTMPPLAGEDSLGGYGRVLRAALLPLLERRKLPAGGLAVVFDRDHTEASGYAAALAELTGEPVWLAPMAADHDERPGRFVDGVLQVRDDRGRWHDIRAALRLVTARPWSRFPVGTRTALLNPVIACLAGGRNKLMAAKAYAFFNAQARSTGLEVRTPMTVGDVDLREVPFQVRRLGGHAVVKVPYAHAGQGVYTVTSPRELEAFTSAGHRYDRFVVQSLVGNASWSHPGGEGRLFHVGTVPDRKCQVFAADLRMMVAASPSGFAPIACYARRAPLPLEERLDPETPSWEVLGTNLSRRRADGSWETDHDRLLLMEGREFQALGLGLDGLIEAYVQTVLAITAIDRLAAELMTARGGLHPDLFRSLNDDPALIAELDRGKLYGTLSSRRPADSRGEERSYLDLGPTVSSAVSGTTEP